MVFKDKIIPHEYMLYLYIFIIFYFAFNENENLKKIKKWGMQPTDHLQPPIPPVPP